MDQENKPKKSPIIWIIVIVIIIVVGVVVVYFVTQNKNENANTAVNTVANKTTNKTTATNTSVDPYADLMKYDGKVVNITSADGKVTGKLAISYRKGEQMPMQVVYFLKVTDNLPKTTGAVGGASYYYIASHAKAADIRVGKGTGVLAPAYCNKDQMPDVLAMAKSGDLNVTTYTGCEAQNDVYASTNTFYQVYSAYYNNYDFDYNEIVGKDTLAVFDSAPFYTADPSTGGYSADKEKVISQGDITTQYSLTYSD